MLSGEPKAGLDPMTQRPRLELKPKVRTFYRLRPPGTPALWFFSFVVPSARKHISKGPEGITLTRISFPALVFSFTNCKMGEKIIFNENLRVLWKSGEMVEFLKPYVIF